MGVSVGHLLKTGKAATAPESIAVFSRPESKGIPGSGANILNTPAASLCCFQLPGTLFRNSLKRNKETH